MIFSAEINIMPRPELLDPQGKAVANNMKHIRISGVDNVRIGKRISLDISTDSEAQAREAVKEMCLKLLSNPIMENFSFELKQKAV